MKDNPVAKNAHKFNKSQVMKDRKKAMKKGERKHKGKVDEKLSASDDAGEWVKDFRKSDAPQFKGKSDKKKQQMAIAAYLDAKKGKREESMEEKKGLWDRIHAKRKRGEKPAKPGEKGYPKTLDVGEGLKQARKNVGSDSCWPGYKATGTKMKNGKEVPDCKKEEVEQVEEGSDVHARYMRVHGKKAKGNGRWIFTTSRNSQSQGKEFVHQGNFSAAHKAAQKHFGTKDVYVMEWACNRTEKARRVSGGDKRKKYMKEKQVEGKLPTAFDRQMKNKEAEAARKQSNAEVRAARKDQQRNAVDSKVNEELTPIQKRKYMNLKKRAKAGNSQAKIRLKSFEKEFAKEIDMEKSTATQAKKGQRGKGVADPHSGQSFSGRGTGGGDDNNLIVQLRKAQDMDGKEPVKLKGNKSVKVPKSLIDKLLAAYDKIQKPQDKKKFELMVTKELRKRAK